MLDSDFSVFYEWKSYERPKYTTEPLSETFLIEFFELIITFGEVGWAN